MQRSVEFLLEASRDRVAATRQRADHHTLGGIEIRKNRPSGMPQPTGHPMPYDSIADGLRDDQADSRSGVTRLIGMKCIQNKVRL
ncbi:hypothetical protein MPRF_13920 [Mycolicibacterium parafortuitum]|uniref:Uncharacterized protein n=1 Tax=Mycolicibacterium parafortuitum TaxID=39692 RepID=A0A7I7U0P3_MYCPF|nr:hypothetical protein MPRF_13920 [Mycolicibacterium parafortuitum]